MVSETYVHAGTAGKDYGEVRVHSRHEQRVGLLEHRIRVGHRLDPIHQDVVDRDDREPEPPRQLKLTKRLTDPSLRNGHLLDAEPVAELHVVEEHPAGDPLAEADPRLALGKDGLRHADLVDEPSVLRRYDLHVDLARSEVPQHERRQGARRDVVSCADYGAVGILRSELPQRLLIGPVPDRGARDPARHVVDAVAVTVERGHVVSRRVERLGDTRPEVPESHHDESLHPMITSSYEYRNAESAASRRRDTAAAIARGPTRPTYMRAIVSVLPTGSSDPVAPIDSPTVLKALTASNM
jgi:hypothetical protein